MGRKGFVEKDRTKLRKLFCDECEKSWAENGFKKTSISDLTKNIGVAVGTFYIMYTSKEELFFDTIIEVQNKLKEQLRNIVKEDKSINGLVAALKWQYKEYDHLPYLYDYKSDDFISFISKLSEENIKTLKFDNKKFFLELIEDANLELKIEEEKALSIINAMLHTITLKEIGIDNTIEIFDFLINSTINDLFKERG